MRRTSSIVGTLLIVFGSGVLALGIRYSQRPKLVDAGDLPATVTEHRRLPNGVGGLAIVVGSMLLVGAAADRRRGRSVF